MGTIETREKKHYSFVPIVLRVLIVLSLSFFLAGCCPPVEEFSPPITYIPQEKHIQKLACPFHPLTKEELCTEWGKELFVGLHFASELDLYRAITAFKRGKIFLPPSQKNRRNQFDYHLLQCYYLAERYEDALQLFETTGLYTVETSFPAAKEMAVIVYDCYQKTGQCEKAEKIFALLQLLNPEAAANIQLGERFLAGDLDALSNSSNERVQTFAADYCANAKSIGKARLYNALLPGAGYLYVGQKQTALTSFCINVLFTTAAIYSFRNNNVPLGVILTSLEGGWYFGGINGAGLAAQKYNEIYYASNGKEVMVCEKLFPILNWETSF